MHTRIESQEYPSKPNIYVRERPLHWFIMFICFLFIFLLALESVAFVILGAWNLSIPRLQDVQSFSGAIYRREIGFGILLVVLGSLGILICIFGVIAMFSLRILLLRIFAACLWFFMILGIIIGIIGIIFASQVDGFMNQDRITNPNLIEKNYYEEKFLLGMNGGLTLFMSLTMLLGLVIINCLTSDVYYRSYVRTK